MFKRPADHGALKGINPVKRILLIAVPGIGDAFLATPLIGALKHAYPNAAIDVLVRDGKAILDGNPQVSDVLVQPRRPPLRQTLSLLARIFRKYDLAISTSTTDRAFVVLFFAARIRIGKIASMNRKTWWKRRVVNAFVRTDPDVHVLSENLRIADAIGIERQYLPVFPALPRDAIGEAMNLPFEPAATSFAVFHMKPGTLVRQWPEGYWRALIGALRRRGLAVVATGGNSLAERQYIEDILAGISDSVGFAPACNLAGKLPFHRVVELLRGAALFVGTDTSTTHLAAATGVPTVALFGPTDPVRWGPWPVGIEQDGSPWNRQEATQSAGNVTLLRACCSCASSKQECRLTPGMPGACMQTLAPETVLAAIDGILEHGHRLGRLG